ncbi:MAG: exodeoxyribonuclease VII small subunit [Oscillospiraceae bacterium]|nr:exodeoxyribonuclease VII small subunit [Oscillospiraceae bacterium]
MDKAEETGALTFETAAARVEEIVRSLERGDAPLDAALSLFEEGAKLIGVCGKMLDEAEQKLVMLQKGPGGEPQEVEFEAGE